MTGIATTSIQMSFQRTVSPQERPSRTTTLGASTSGLCLSAFSELMWTDAAPKVETGRRVQAAMARAGPQASMWCLAKYCRSSSASKVPAADTVRTVQVAVEAPSWPMMTVRYSCSAVAAVAVR